MISQGSGGGVYPTDKSKIGDVTEIIQVGLGSSTVHIVRWSGAISANETSVPFLIDRTVDEFSISVSGAWRAPDVILFKPTGKL